MRQERQHSELIHDVETFKPDQLKHADTKEKIILPNAKGIIETYLIFRGILDSQIPCFYFGRDQKEGMLLLLVLRGDQNIRDQTKLIHFRFQPLRRNCFACPIRLSVVGSLVLCTASTITTRCYVHYRDKHFFEISQ